MCGLGMGWPATRAASCLAADSGRTASGRVRLASARSCVPLRMRSITTGVSHLEPILHRATKRIRFCEMLAGATTDPRRAALVRVPLLADSDPKARSALRIRKAGKSTQFTSLASLGRIGDTAQSVRASDARNCRYQQSPAWLQSDDAAILIPERNNFDSRTNFKSRRDTTGPQGRVGDGDGLHLVS